VVRTRNFYPFNVDDLALLLKENRYRFVSDDRHEWFMVSFWGWFENACFLKQVEFLSAEKMCEIRRISSKFKFIQQKQQFQEEIGELSESPYFELRNSMTNESFKLVDNEDEILQLVNEGNAIAVEQDDIHLSFSVPDWCELVHMPVSYLVNCVEFLSVGRVILEFWRVFWIRKEVWKCKSGTTTTVVKNSKLQYIILNIKVLLCTMTCRYCLSMSTVKINILHFRLIKTCSERRRLEKITLI
jgi:hypothetical protein